MVTSSLVGAVSPPVAVLKGPALADAVEQVLTATAREPGMPVLGGLRIEASGEAVTPTATDRYRLSTRSLVPVEAAAVSWGAAVDGGTGGGRLTAGSWRHAGAVPGLRRGGRRADRWSPPRSAGTTGDRERCRLS